MRLPSEIVAPYLLSFVAAVKPAVVDTVSGSVPMSCPQRGTLFYFCQKSEVHQVWVDNIIIHLSNNEGLIHFTVYAKARLVISKSVDCN